LNQQAEDSPDRAPRGAAVLREGVTSSIRQGLLHELAEHGYARTSIEAVARRAGVGKAAIYRRWSSKLDLVVAVLSATALQVTDTPDTGDLAGDLLAFLRSARRLLEDPLARRIIPDLIAEAGRQPELAAVLHDTVAGPRRELGRQVVQRAIDRGELRADLDVGLALDLVPATVYWRVSVRRSALPDDELERLAHAVAAALAAL